MRITSCEMVREYLLAAGWDAGGRRQAAEVLQHAQGCAECRAALEDFDRVRATLAPGETAEPAEPAGGWEAMHGRMGELLESHTTVKPAPVRPPVVRPSLAIAAALMAVAAATFQIGRFFTPLPPVPTTMAVPVYLVDPQRAEPAPPTISTVELTNDVETFRKVAGGSDGRAGWMVVSNTTNAPQVGMIADSATPGNRLLLLRLDLWHGRDLAANLDLLILTGQTAELSERLPSGQVLHYRIHPTTSAAGENAAKLNLQLELKTPSGEPLATLATNLWIHPDQIISAGTLATSEGEFELKLESKEADLENGR